ncbi:unnamed protein product [Porites evermanni]|uniref:Uncharacterized protein n=1 Tax=Porites evermanni TaxID=104178 RepID=A0ABN8SUI0_9CNID|nr:unnamed protein product [Porites evermanni]
MDNQAQITETISRLDSGKNQRAKAGSMAFRSRTFHAMYLALSPSPKLTYAKPVACKKASKNKFVMSSARDLQTSNIIFTVGANR